MSGAAASVQMKICVLTIDELCRCYLKNYVFGDTIVLSENSAKAINFDSIKIMYNIS